MISFERIVFERLSAVAAVTALVEQRIYREVAPQGARCPFIVHTVVSDVPTNSALGYSHLSNARVQVDSYGATQDEAKAVADAVNDVLGSVAEVGFSSFRDQRRNGYDDEGEGRYRVSIDFSMWSQEG